MLLFQRMRRPACRQADGSFSFLKCGVEIAACGSVRVLVGVIDAALRACRRSLPFEGCGVLFAAGGELRTIATVPNRASTLDAFEIDPLDVAAVVERLRPHRLYWCGWFHSHVAGAPTPSRRDRVSGAFLRMAHLHLIVGPRGAWRLYAVDSTGWRQVAVRLIAGEQLR
ncbi:MAG: hypothetical protein D6744_12780 [Planctomycetota bacterium]|nr:MAG: hypothetical protein D6744_12780 [Planctomycetota bacterium]